MKKLGIRICNGVDMTRICSCAIRGSSRGFISKEEGWVCAIETYSNTESPTIRTMPSFVLVIIPKKKK